MNIGKKITLLKESAGFKNYKEFGDFVGLSNDWCLELSKKQEINTIDITRLIQIANKFNVTVDWLLSDVDGEDIQDQLFSDEDISSILGKLQTKIKNEDCYFEGTLLNSDATKLAYDSINVVKKLLRQNL